MLAVSDAAAPQQAPQGQFVLGATTLVCLHTASPLLGSKNVHTHITPLCLIYDTNSQKRVFALDLSVRIRANIICFQWRVSYVWSVEMKHPCDSERVTKGLCVRMKGLEPPRPKTLDPKSNAATNYATCAVFGCKVSAIILFLQIYFFGSQYCWVKTPKLILHFWRVKRKIANFVG